MVEPTTYFMETHLFTFLLNSTTEPTRFRNDEVPSLAAQIILGILTIIIATVSITGNLMTCLIVYRKTAMRSAINLLLTNVALADLLLSTTVIPFVLCRLFKRTLAAYLVVCICFSVLKDAILCIVAYTLLVISLDRYFIIVRRKDGLCPKNAKVAIGVVWCSGFAATLPQFISLRGDQFKCYDRLMCDITIYCYTEFTKTYSVVLICFIFIVPMIAMFYIYTAILRSVQQSSKRVHNHPGSAVSVAVTQYSCKLGLPTVAIPCRFSGDFNAKRRAFGTILIMFVVLLSCWLPYMVNRLVLTGLHPQVVSLDIVTTMVLLCFGFLKGALYPIIYGVRNKKFRVACQGIIPSSIKIPEKWYKFKGRKINPRVMYEYSESDTRI